jgi:hypothetical protein
MSPEWVDSEGKPVDMAHAAGFWEQRYRVQHRKVHAMEDEIARLRAELQEKSPGRGPRKETG